MARPTKLTPPVKERILDLLRVGNRRIAAARAAGINEATFFRWMADTRPLYREFRDAVEVAEAEAETQAVANIWAAMPREPRWNAWWLENRHSHWRRRQEPPLPEVEAPTPEPKPASGDVFYLSSEDLKRLSRERMERENPVSDEVRARRARLVSDSADP